MSRSRLASLARWSVVALSMTTPAHAHGQEVLGPLAAHAGVITVMLLFLLGSRAGRLFWLPGLAGLIAGVLLSWYLTRGLPYRQHSTLITLILVIVPVAVAGAAWVTSYAIVRARKRREK